jgi:hypothetical protein
MAQYQGRLGQYVNSGLHRRRIRGQGAPMQFGSNHVHAYSSQALSNPDEVLRLVIQAVNQNHAGHSGRLPGSTYRRKRS